MLLLTACQDTYLDLDPQDSITETSYFKAAEHFKSASNNLYFGLTGWRTLWGGVEYFDYGTDLNGLTTSCKIKEFEFNSDGVLPA